MAFSLRSALASLALVCVLFVAVAPTAAVADVPSNCTYDDFLGTWAVTLSSVLPPPSYPSLNCNFSWDAEDHFNVSFAAPNTGLYAGAGMSWTLIYNQGIEIWAGSVVHFAFSNYDAAGNSLCQSTSVGYFHTTDLEEWRCVSMKKIADAEDSPAALARAQAPTVSASEQAEREKERELAAERAYDPERLNTVFTTDHAFLAKVNEAAAGMFTVKHYPELDGMTIGQLERRRGSAYAHEMASTPQAMGVPPALLTHEEAHRTPQQIQDVPDNFDWRNVSGVNYVSPVRDQGQCGSCYIFSSAGQLEARIRIKSGNTQQPILSTQDAVDCSSYSQGCDGGFPYLLAGKYGFDYGFTEEACNTYKGVDGVCQINSTDSCSNRWKTDSYQYVGGYYGASTMERMQREIMANGPISVGFFVYDEFMHYAGGVYTHQFAADLQLDDYNPFVLVNHAVLMVGWGVTDDDKKTPYWIVKNSWSEKWGEQGFFRILRSSDESMGGECGIQSLSVSASPVLH